MSRKIILTCCAMAVVGQVVLGQIAPLQQPRAGVYPLPSRTAPTTGIQAPISNQQPATTGLHSGATSRPSSGYVPPKSYSSFYSGHVKKYHRPPDNARDYTIDQHFYHRPTISPYLNLTRRERSTGTSNYHQYVRPELNRRASANQSREAPPSAKFSPYYQKMYGNR